MSRFIAFLFTCALATPLLAQTYSMDAPDRVGMRDAIDVGWSAPEGESGLVEIRPPGENARRVSYAYTQKNPLTIEAPEVPGDYVMVLIIEKEIRVSQPLTVEPATAVLDAPGQSDAGADIVVTWEGPDNRNDNITFAARDGDPMRGVSYAYVSSSKDGTVRLRAPKDAGAYDIVYVSGKTVLARVPITVGSITATLTAKEQLPAGSSVAVGFDGPMNSGDLITFAARDGDRISPASYGYVANSNDGTVTLRAFEALGPYDIVYVSGGRVIGRLPVEIVPVTMALEAAAEVQALLAFEVAWDGTGNPGDQIFLVEPGGSDSGVYSYVDPAEPVVVLTAPEQPGAFELVYITRGGQDLARRAITVTPAPVAPGEIEVMFVPGSGFGPEDAVEVILDASGSMLKRQGSERRIEIARRTLGTLVQETIPAGTGFALRVFGNREADACRTDLEIPLAPHDPAQAASLIAGITAINLAKTPIAASIALTLQDLAGVTGERVVILITDGEETCEGDPAQAIEALRAAGVDARVNIVGYAIDDADLARTFEAWAAAGGGQYFDAADADQLGAALEQAMAVPFEIVTPDGVLVGAGLAGDPPLTVPAGDYVVRVGGAEVPATVTSGTRTQVSP